MKPTNTDNISCLILGHNFYKEQTSYINSDNLQTTGLSHGHIFSASGTVTFEVSSTYNHSVGNGITNGHIQASKMSASGQSEGNNSNLSMIAGGAASRIIRAYDVVGNALVEDTANNICLPFELDGLCDQFCIDDNGSVLMGSATSISSVYRTDGTFEILKSSTTPIYPYMSYVQSTDSAYLVTYKTYVYNISPFPTQ